MEQDVHVDACLQFVGWDAYNHRVCGECEVEGLEWVAFNLYVVERYGNLAIIGRRYGYVPSWRLFVGDAILSTRVSDTNPG